MTRNLTSIAIAPDWYEAMERRISRRKFDGRPVSGEVLDRIESLCANVSASDGGARAVVVKSAPQGVFQPIIRGYGAIENAPSLVALLGPKDSDVEVGYLGEAVILDATAVGAATCWIAGSFDRERMAGLMELADHEVVHALTPLGYAPAHKSGVERAISFAIRSRRRLPLENIAPGCLGWPSWARRAAEAVRIAPSGANGQPWRLRFDDGALVIARKDDKPYWTWRLDCGIAMLHAEIGARQEGAEGRWELLGEPDVAAYRVQ